MSDLTLSELEAAGALDVMRPDEVAQHVTASVMRRLLGKYEHWQLGSTGMPEILGTTIERELRTALRSVARYRQQGLGL